MNCGEVRWYRFAPSDRRRPVVVLTRDSIIPYLKEVTVAPVTATVRDIPTEVFLSRTEGMPREVNSRSSADGSCRTSSRLS